MLFEGLTGDLLELLLEGLSFFLLLLETTAALLLDGLLLAVLFEGLSEGRLGEFDDYFSAAGFF